MYMKVVLLIVSFLLWGILIYNGAYFQLLLYIKVFNVFHTYGYFLMS